MRFIQACPRSLLDDRQGIRGIFTGQEGTFLTPADNLAALIDTHNADHAILVLNELGHGGTIIQTGEICLIYCRATRNGVSSRGLGGDQEILDAEPG